MGVCVMAGFASVDVLKYCAIFVGSFVVFDSSEKLSGCLSHVVFHFKFIIVYVKILQV